MVNGMHKRFGAIETEQAAARTVAAAHGLAVISNGAVSLASDKETAQAVMVAKVIAEMKKRINVDVTLPEWADYASVDKFELTSAFKDLTGIPPMMFHNAERLEMAKRLLVFENLNVTDVCFDIGFESVGSFVSKFSQCVGIPPGSFAREMRAAGCAKAFIAAIQGGRQTSGKHGPDRKLTFDRPAARGRRSLIAALFRRPYPCGMPVAWRFISPVSGTTTIQADFDGYCLVASMPFSPRLSGLVNFRPALVGSERLFPGGGERHIPLRPPAAFDPPVTLAVPALFCRQPEAE